MSSRLINNVIADFCFDMWKKMMQNTAVAMLDALTCFRVRKNCVKR